MTVIHEHRYQRRITALREAVKSSECDAFMSVDPSDNAYLTGFFGSTSSVLITEGAARLLCDFRYAEQAASLTSGVEITECTGSLDVRLAEHLNQESVKRAAYDPGAITVARRDDIQSPFAGELHGVAGICRNVRERKEPGEIERIRAASQLAEEALVAMLDTLVPGVRECEAAALLEYEFRKRGAQRAAFDTIVLFGSRSSLPHGMPGQRTLETGDIVLVDCGCVLDGYCSDLTRTFVFGRIPGNWFEDIYECVRLAQEAAVRTVKDGIAARTVDAAARTPITDAGYGDRFGHGTGHGVGLDVHENPRLNAQSSAELTSGMVVTVEPGIYLPGQGGVRIEDLLVVTDGGCEVLTELPKELRIL